jgi:hypothetical protein
MPLYILSTTSGSASGELIQTKATDIDIEEHLENWLENSPTVLLENEPILWVGRQPSAATAETVLFPDLIGLDSGGNLVLVEVKRGRTPRDVIAQGLEYAAWASGLTYQELERLASTYWESKGEPGSTLEDAFREMFLAEDQTAPLPQFNQRQILFFVAEEIHPRVAQVAHYLREQGRLDVRCVVFDVFRAVSGEIVVSVDTIVGEAVRRPLIDDIGSGTWSAEKTASQVIYETVQGLLRQPGKETFSPSEAYHEILKTYPDFNRGTNNAQIIADCVNHPSRKHYPGRKPDHYFRVDRGVYRLYDPQGDGTWDQEGNLVESAP